MKYRYYSHNITSLADNEVFVFGSNLAGRHGKGAALTAAKLFSAKYGVGVGITGDCYAIPTKDQALYTLSLFSIEQYIFFFKEHAKQHPDFTYVVTKVGCGLAGYSDAEIAQLFKYSPENCVFHQDWEVYLD